MLKNSQNCYTNSIFKKVQSASENVLTGTFLPLGSGLATPGLEGEDGATVVDSLMVVLNKHNYILTTVCQFKFGQIR